MKKYWFVCLLIVYTAASQNNNNLIYIPALPTKEVYKVHIDKKGFLWVAHELGLSRYDGIAFSHFSMPQSTSLSITEIAEDANGRMWCNNVSGQIFYIENEQMHLLQAFDYASQQNINFLTIIDSQLLVTSNRGLFEYNIYTKKGVYINDCNNKQLPSILNGVKTKAGYLLLTSNGWFIYNSNTKIQPLKSNYLAIIPKAVGEFNLFYFKDTLIVNNRISGESTLANLYQDSLFFYKPTNKLNYNKPIPAITKMDICLQLNGPEVDRERSFIYKNAISDIVPDKQGNVWMSSLTTGLLLYVNKEQYSLKQPPYMAATEKGLLMYIDATVEYVATNNNTFYAKQKNALKKYTIPKNHGRIESFFVTNNATTVVISTPLHPIILNGKTGKQKNLPPTSIIKEIVFYKEIAIAVTPAGVRTFSIDPTVKDSINSDKDFKTLTNISRNAIPNYILTQRTRSVAYDSVNRVLFLALKDGLVAIKSTGVYFLKYRQQRINASSLLLVNQTLFVGTLNAGVFAIDLNNYNKIYQYTTQNGLLSNTVVKLKYLHNYLWAVNINGVQQINIQQQKIIHQYLVPQVSGTSIKDILLQNNELYFSTLAGIFTTPLKKEINEQKPLNYFQYALFGKDTVFTNNITKSHKYNNIQVKVAAIWFSNPRAVFFKYRLIKNNKSSEWLALEKGQRFITFQDINPGNYVLEAVAVNEYNVEAAKAIQFSFNIKNPWYKTNVALLVFLLLGILLVYGILQLRINIIKSRNKLLVEKLQLQNQLGSSILTAIKSQMNPHFVFNALNTIKSYIYTNNKQEANAYLNKFSNLIRFVLEASEKERIVLSEEINMLQLYIDLEKMRFEENLTAKIDIDELVDTEVLYIPTMMLQPYVENAIKHGLLHKEGAKELYIHFFIDSHQQNLMVIIKDNGIGRTKSQAINQKRADNHNSFATVANQKRVSIINQLLKTKINLQIADNSLPNESGTTVTISIPLDIMQP